MNRAVARLYKGRMKFETNLDLFEDPKGSGLQSELLPPETVRKTDSGVLVLKPASGTRAIEDEAFPFERLSDIGEHESWRKEVFRPVYHMHKWWAQRLGSVFRAMLIGAFSPKGSDIGQLFYQPVRIPGTVVFDPFMGSGTTLGEALKLGIRAIGRDINPVSYFAVRNALGTHPQAKVLSYFREIERDTAPSIREWYRTHASDGSEAQALYYFWVKVLPCPSCNTSVDLFSSYVFSQNAYARLKPEARAVCPHCSAINFIRYDAEVAFCSGCQNRFEPQNGPAQRQHAVCPSCRAEFPIAKRVREIGRPPDHRMYAKLVLCADGRKEYVAVDDFDRELYAAAQSELSRKSNAFPIAPIQPGYNTDQALGYCYEHWHQFFNDRQLLVISILADRIKASEDEHIRDVFTCLLSGTLEFNNMFTSFKGEGTGAVRHMFSHHILKPERTPLEANLWGTPKSSGSFSTLFKSRLVRGIQYAEKPFELDVVNGRNEKVKGLSASMGRKRADSFEEFARLERDLYLSCGDSAHTDLPDDSVDAVVTDPPFFDNVNYSQLADFFYVWQRHILGDVGHHAGMTTRADREVQNGESREFTNRLKGVWLEAHRVLRKDGILLFTYHHSRPEGWWSVLNALVSSGFFVSAAQPIKGEMSVAAPKHQAKEPIDLDIILVCRKRKNNSTENEDNLAEALATARTQVRRFRAAERKLSRNDIRVVLMGQVLRVLSRRPLATAEKELAAIEERIESEINALNGA